MTLSDDGSISESVVSLLDGNEISRQMSGGYTYDPRSQLEVLGYGPPSLAEIDLFREPIMAYVNHGRWIWSCDCGAPGFSKPGGLVWLDCLLGWDPCCKNVRSEGRWCRLVLPRDWKLIEAILVCRPNVENQNWDHDESIYDLIEQNREHGDPIPEGIV